MNIMLINCIYLFTLIKYLTTFPLFVTITKGFTEFHFFGEILLFGLFCSSFPC